MFNSIISFFCHLLKKIDNDKVVEFTTVRDLTPYLEDILLGNPKNRDSWGRIISQGEYLIINDANGTSLYHDFYDKPFNPIAKGHFNQLKKFNGGWQIKENEETYAIDNTGKRIIGASPDYDRITRFDDRYSYVWKGDNCGLLDTSTGHLVIPIKYAHIDSRSWNQPGEFEVKDHDRKFGYYSVKERRFTMPIGTCDEIAHNIGKMLIVEKNGRYGAFKDGKWIVPMKHTGFGGWNEMQDKLFFDDDNQNRTGLTFYVYTFDGKLIATKFFYNNQRRQYKQWQQIWYQ